MAWWGKTDAGTSPVFKQPNADGWSQTTFDAEDPELEFLLKVSPNWDPRDNLIARKMAVPADKMDSRIVDIWLIEDDERVYYAQPELKVGPLWKQHVRKAFSDTTRSVTARISNIPPAGSSVEVTTDLSKWKLWDHSANSGAGALVALSGSDPVTFTADRITLNTAADLIPNHHYEVWYDTNNNNQIDTGDDQVISDFVTMRRMLDDFKYTGSEPLGMSYSETATTFRLWAPTAQKVEVLIYDTLEESDFEAIGQPGDSPTRITDAKWDDPDQTLAHTAHDPATGLWTITYTGDILPDVPPGQNNISKGFKYYVYRITYADGEAALAPDPYAIAASPNGWMSAIIDMGQTEITPTPQYRSFLHDSASSTDAVLYELHIRDFSIHASSGISDDNKGKYLAFTEKDTFVPDSPNTATGIDHLIELGVTHVHLLPTFDYGSVDELQPNRYNDAGAFNWGYDPQNYNVPEGNYASDVFNPYTRVVEFKRMVDALHAAGIKVVMDVVFNHTYSVNDGPFQRAVPGYYYRTGIDDGLYSDGAGCGNEVADERAMVRKYIVDSVSHWQQAYGIDGFRFDLMGLHTVATMEAVSAALHAHDEQAIIYGEPWAGYGWSDGFFGGRRVLPEGVIPIYRGAQKNQGWSFFNDNWFRTPMKGSPDHNAEHNEDPNQNDNRGFITGRTKEAGVILHGARASQHPNNGADNPVANAEETINYITAHDNLNLYDKIAVSFWNNGSPAVMIWDEHKPSEYPTNPPRLPAPGFDSIANITDKGGDETRTGGVAASVQAQLLGAGIVLSSQGTPFIQAGDEFLRSKQGHKNSYNARDHINAINWQQKADYPLVFDYYKGLMALRSAHPAFRMNELGRLNANFHAIGYTDPTNAASQTDFVNNGPGGVGAVPGVVAYRLDGEAVADSWKNIYVVYNGNETLSAAVKLGHAAPLTQVVNHERVDMDGIGSPIPVDDWPLVPPRSIAIFYDAEVEPPTGTHNIIIEIHENGGFLDSRADVHVWQDGGAVLANSPFLFSPSGAASHLTLAPIHEKQLGRDFGFIVRATGEWEPAGINNAINGFDPGDTDINRFFGAHPIESNTKIVLQAGQKPVRVLPQAVPFVHVDQTIEFRWRDQQRFVARVAQDDAPAPTPKVRYSTDGGATWLNGVGGSTLTHSGQHEMYALKSDTVFDYGDSVRYEFSLDDGANWAADVYNLVDGRSALEISEPKIGFAHAEFNERQLNVLVVEGLANVVSVTADLSKFGLDASVAIPMLTPGRFSKVVEAGIAGIGLKNADITINYDDGTSVVIPAQTTVTDDTSTTFDWDEAIIYFMVTDRFAKAGNDGKPETPNPNIVSTRPDDPDLGVNGRQLGQINGGDFRGLIAGLDYLKALGVNTVWVTPIIDNIPGSMAAAPDVQEAYHGYWARAFDEINARLGSAADLRELTSELHKRNMKLMVDIVINHAGYDMSDVHGEATVPHFRLDNGDSMFRPITSKEPGSPYPESTGPDADYVNALAGLPDFRTEDKRVREKLVAWQTYWMSEYEIDYFRVDTVKHVEHGTWEALKSAVIEQNKDFKMIGELWDGAWNKTDGYLHTGSMDSLVDFPFHNIARNFVYDDSDLDYIQEELGKRETFLADEPLLSLGQFLSNHDRDNFATTLSGSREQVEAMLQAAASLQITALGQPIIYYGEDVGQYGLNAGGPYGGAGTMNYYHPNRYSFDWAKTFDPGERHNDAIGAAINHHYRAILNARGLFSKAYAKGARTYYSDPAGHVLAFMAVHEGEMVLTFINRTEQTQSINITEPALGTGTTLIDYYAMLRSGDRGEASDISVGAGGSFSVSVPAMHDGGTVILSDVLIQSLDVGTQDKTPVYGAAGSVGYSVETLNVADGNYPISVQHLPAGVSLASATLDIVDNTGYFSLNVAANTPAGTYSNLRLLLGETDPISASFSLVMDKAPPVISWDFADNLTATVGETLADVALPADNGSGTPGTFHWTAGDDTPVGAVGEQTHNIRFQPADADNYLAAHKDVTITVSDTDEPNPPDTPVLVGLEIIHVPPDKVVELSRGGSQKLELAYSFEPDGSAEEENALKNVYWTTNNADVATVAADGTVTVKADAPLQAVATIRVRSLIDNDLTDFISVRVVGPDVIDPPERPILLTSGPDAGLIKPHPGNDSAYTILDDLTDNDGQRKSITLTATEPVRVSTNDRNVARVGMVGNGNNQVIDVMYQGSGTAVLTITSRAEKNKSVRVKLTIRDRMPKLLSDNLSYFSYNESGVEFVALPSDNFSFTGLRVVDTPAQFSVERQGTSDTFLLKTTDNFKPPLPHQQSRIYPVSLQAYDAAGDDVGIPFNLRVNYRIAAAPSARLSMKAALNTFFATSSQALTISGSNLPPIQDIVLKGDLAANFDTRPDGLLWLIETKAEFGALDDKGRPKTRGDIDIIYDLADGGTATQEVKNFNVRVGTQKPRLTLSPATQWALTTVDEPKATFYVAATTGISVASVSKAGTNVAANKVIQDEISAAGNAFTVLLDKDAAVNNRAYKLRLQLVPVGARAGQAIPVSVTLRPTENPATAQASVSVTATKGNIDLINRENSHISYVPRLANSPAMIALDGDVVSFAPTGSGTTASENWDRATEKLTVEMMDGNAVVTAKEGATFSKGERFSVKLAFTMADGSILESNNLRIRPANSKVRHNIPRINPLFQSRSGPANPLVIDLSPIAPTGARVATLDFKEEKTNKAGQVTRYVNNPNEAYWYSFDEYSQTLYVWIKDSARLKPGNARLTFSLTYEGQGMEKNGRIRPVDLRVPIRISR